MKKISLIAIALFLIFDNLAFGQDTLPVKTDSVKTIGEITLIGQRKAVKIENGRTILDLQNPSLFESKLMDAMQVVPGVQIDRANKILTFENKNVQLYVDGKQIQIPSDAVYSYIQSIPTVTIKQIEFDAHPGAKYDAGSQDAVIDITTKKAKQNHLNFNPYASYNQFRYNSYTYGASLFGSLKNFDFALSYEDYHEKDFNDKTSQDIYYQNPLSPVDYTRNDITNEIGRERYQTINGTVGYKTVKNDIIFSYLRTAIKPSDLSVKKTDLIYPDHIQNFTTDQTGKQTNVSNSYTGVYNYRIDTLGTALKFFLDHTEVNYRNEINQSYFGFGKDSTNMQKIGTNIKLNTFKIDFNNREKAKYRLEVGFKYSWTKNKFHNFYSSFNDYLYGVNEDIMSSYVSVRRSWKNFNLTLGIRGENTVLKGKYFDNLINQSQSVDKNNYKIFPDIYLEYLWKKNALALIANTKIQRPSYDQYNPLEIINDPYSISRGNPVLLSASVYDYTLKYTYNKKYSFSVFLTNTHDQVGSIVVSNENNVSITEPINLDYSNYYGINAGGNFDLTKWWNISYWAEFNNIDKKGTLPDRLIKIHIKNSYSFSINQQFKLPYDIMLNLNAFIEGNRGWRIYETSKPYGSISFYAKKEFLNKKLTVELSVNDILNTNNRLSVNYQDNFYRSQFTNYYPSRAIGVGISYNFNTKINKLSVNTDTEEKNRTK